MIADELEFKFMHSGIPGCEYVIAIHQDWCVPLGHVWFRCYHRETAIDILNSFVIESARREGIRTAIHEFLIDAHPGLRTITTDGASESGKAWMDSMGFKKSEVGFYYLEVNQLDSENYDE